MTTNPRQVSYTNRKGITYYLCKTASKSGQPRYTFAREPKGQPVGEIPDGWETSESVNGIVSLVKHRPQLVKPEELAAVEAALDRHPKSQNYRTAVKSKAITLYECLGPDMDDLLEALSGFGGFARADMRKRLEAEFERFGRFTPIMRFTLIDQGRRIFVAARMSFFGAEEEWLDLNQEGPIRRFSQSQCSWRQLGGPAAGGDLIDRGHHLPAGDHGGGAQSGR